MHTLELHLKGVHRQGKRHGLSFPELRYTGTEVVGGGGGGGVEAGNRITCRHRFNEWLGVALFYT